MSALLPHVKTPISVSYKFRKHKVLHHRLTFALPDRYHQQDDLFFYRLETSEIWPDVRDWLTENVGENNWHTGYVPNPHRRSFFFRTESQAFYFKLVWA